MLRKLREAATCLLREEVRQVALPVESGTCAYGSPVVLRQINDVKTIDDDVDANMPNVDYIT